MCPLGRNGFAAGSDLLLRTWYFFCRTVSSSFCLICIAISQVTFTEK
uniref:Uncharacterized protein n=1 Tax=Rhizophora mucronata TaxID=61149 RepID=A0A2P2PZM3_RHIMU